MMTVIAAILIPAMGLAQSKPISDLFDKYQGKDGFTTVIVNEDAFKLISNMEKTEGELKQPLTRIRKVRVLAQDDDSVGAGLNFYDELQGSMDFSVYKELVVVKESDQDVRVLARDSNGRLSELLVIVGGDDNVLVWIEGDFTLEELSQLSQLGGIEGLDILKGM